MNTGHQKSSPTAEGLTNVPPRPSVGRGDALAELKPFDRRVMGSNPVLAATQGPWATP